MVFLAEPRTWRDPPQQLAFDLGRFRLGVGRDVLAILLPPLCETAARPQLGKPGRARSDDGRCSVLAGPRSGWLSESTWRTFIAKDPEMRDNPPSDEPETFHKSFGAYDRQQHVHDRRYPAMHGYYRTLRTLTDTHDASRDRVLLGEIHCFELDQWITHFGDELDEIHLPFNFGLLNIPFTAEAVRSLVESLEQALPAGAWPTYVLGNHDEPRLTTRFGPERARLAAMLLLTLRGTPTLYYGDELGMTDVRVPAELSRDPQGKLMPQLSRDPARSPMLWEAAGNAGFCDDDVPPWLPLEPRVASVAEQASDPTSMLSLYRALLKLRRSELGLREGGYESLEAPEGVFAYERVPQNGGRLRVVLNFTGEAIGSELLSRPLVLSARLDGRRGVPPHTLRPHEGVIVRGF